MCGSAASQHKNTHIWRLKGRQVLGFAGFPWFSGEMLWIVTSITFWKNSRANIGIASVKAGERSI
jgi:hypothetical protein